MHVPLAKPSQTLQQLIDYDETSCDLASSALHSGHAFLGTSIEYGVILNCVLV